MQLLLHGHRYYEILRQLLHTIHDFLLVDK